MKTGQSVPKRRHINSRRRVITQKKAYNIQNKAKAWNQKLNYIKVNFEVSNRVTLNILPIEMWIQAVL